MDSFSQKCATPGSTRSSKLCRASIVSIFAVMQFLLCPETSTAFRQLSLSRSPPTSRLFAVESPEDEITRQLERAKELIAKSKAKLETKGAVSLDNEGVDGGDDTEDAAEGTKNVPFFAAKVKAKENKRDQVVKATNADGLVTIDGDLMAKLSEAEEWEVRSLVEVFEDQQKMSEEPLVNRDVAQSIMGLQKVLQTADYLKIFDKRNRFIGEQ
jgi:hypothetical protein